MIIIDNLYVERLQDSSSFGIMTHCITGALKGSQVCTHEEATRLTNHNHPLETWLTILTVSPACAEAETPPGNKGAIGILEALEALESLELRII